MKKTKTTNLPTPDEAGRRLRESDARIKNALAYLSDSQRGGAVVERLRTVLDHESARGLDTGGLSALVELVQEFAAGRRNFLPPPIPVESPCDPLKVPWVVTYDVTENGERHELLVRASNVIAAVNAALQAGVRAREIVAAGEKGYLLLKEGA